MTPFQTWTPEPLEKVFPNDEPPETSDSDSVSVTAPRDSWVSAQVAITADEDLGSVAATVSPLEHAGGAEIAGDRISARPVGYVPVEENTPDTPAAELVGEAPGRFPDPLLPDSRFEVAAGETRSVWISIRTPEDAPAGRYRGTVSVETGDDTQLVDLGLDLQPVTIPDRTDIWLLNYVSIGRIATFHDVDRWSEPFWELLEAYAENLGDHRQNVINASLAGLVRISVDESDALDFDFSRLDRFVETFDDAGVADRVSIGSLARRPDRVGGRGSDVDVREDLYSTPVEILGPDGSVDHERESVPVSDPSFQEFVTALLSALHMHLEERGWLDRFMLDIADEPYDDVAESYNLLGELVREHAPGLRTIEPTSTHAIAESIDIWVPRLEGFDADKEYYAARQEAGDEVWHYTCLAPRGEYPNRLVDYSLVKVRILQWINFKYGLEGFLHWGYNHWTDAPFEDVENEPNHPGGLPPGDAFIVYPGRDGPIDSMRWEATRAGMEDFALLNLLAEREGEAAAQEFCDRVIQSPTAFVRDPARFRELREELVERVAAATV